MLMCFLQDSRSQWHGAEPPATRATACSHHRMDTRRSCKQLRLTSSEVRGSCHIGKSVQVDDVNNRADHAGGILESRSERIRDFRSHHSNWSKDALTPRDTRGLEIFVSLRFVRDKCPSPPPPPQPSHQFNQGLNGSSAKQQRYCWEPGPCHRRRLAWPERWHHLSWER